LRLELDLDLLADEVATRVAARLADRIAPLEEAVAYTRIPAGTFRKLVAAGQKAITVSDAELAAVNLTRHDFHGDWNYTIRPQLQHLNNSGALRQTAPRLSSQFPGRLRRQQAESTGIGGRFAPLGGLQLPLSGARTAPLRVASPHTAQRNRLRGR
jgi:hypothetical protein